jgi:hypothetical protein
VRSRQHDGLLGKIAVDAYGVETAENKSQYASNPWEKRYDFWRQQYTFPEFSSLYAKGALPTTSASDKEQTAAFGGLACI